LGGLVEYFATSRVAALLAVTVAAAVVVGLLARRRGASIGRSLLLAALVVSMAVIVVATLLRDGLPSQVQWQGLTQWSSEGWARISGSPSASQVLANIVLFAPAGLVLTVLTRAPLVSWMVMAGTAALMEVAQAITAVGVADVADLLANTVGATVGVATGALVLLLDRNAEDRRAPVRFLLVLLVVLAVAAVTMPWAAQERQDRLAQDLADRFAGTDLDVYRQWERDDRLYEEVFDVAGVFADGTSDSGGSVTVRHPASFFLSRRCVLLTWSPDGVDLTRASGSAACDDLLR
jgi:glycopeptide antibiotics resistance protein